MIIFNKFQILSLINEGGNSRIYKGIDNTRSNETGHKHFIAIKTLKKKYLNSSSHSFMIENEYLTTRGLLHKGIIQIYELLHQEFLLALTMEFVDAPTIDYLICTNKLDQSQKIKYIINLAEAISYIHEQGVIHSDIKPSNILVLPNYSLKLIDFGVAELINKSNSKFAYSYSRYYSSPEKKMGFRSNFSDDVYSFGCVAMAIIGYINPYQSFPNKCNPSEFVNDVSKYYKLIKFFHKCTNINSKNRPRDGKNMYQELKNIVE